MLKMLFEIVSAAKQTGIDAETALNKYTDSFIREYAKSEK